MPGLGLHFRVVTMAAVRRMVSRGAKVGDPLAIVAVLQVREGEGLK